MKTTKRFKGILALGLMVLATHVLAVTPDEEEDKKCKKPKFRTFVPEAKSEVAAGSEISFHVSHDADPLTIGAAAKGEKMAVKIVDKHNFYAATARLPDGLLHEFVRLHIEARAAEGQCLGQDGWLIKIKSDAVGVAPATGETKQ